jgi:predicted alpha-1,2-mannosidase
VKLALLITLFLPGLGSAQSPEDLAALVNPFVGTGRSSLNDFGKTVPGAIRPFGMLYWSPDMVTEVFYRYDTPVTRGFSLTHLSGPGCGQFGDVPIFPMLGLPVQSPVVRLTPNPYTARFSHSDEIAQPGYYAVKLDSGIGVRLAAQVRAGIAEFRFPADTRPHTLLVDLSRNLSPHVSHTEIDVQSRTITGSVTSGEDCGGLQNQYRVYFALETDQTPQTWSTFDELSVDKGGHSATGPRTGGYLSFAPSVTTVRLKAGLSFVSTENAMANLRSEVPDWEVDKVRQEARAAWNDALGRILVKGGKLEDRKVFYTALYHSLIHPSVFSDVNGDYIGFDSKVHKADGRKQYANFSGWDIYRSQVQLLAMLFPKVGSDIAQSLVVDAEQGGGLPIWSEANDEASAMVGDPSDCILANLYAFGAREFDTKAALAAMLRGANDPKTHSRVYPQRPDLEEYLRLGYVAERGIPGRGAASVTLEYQSADFAISRFAEALGDTATAQAFLTRSAQWRKLFDPVTKWVRPRRPDGKFLPNFQPGKEDGFVEGNSAQYTWMVPYDLTSVIGAIGGSEASRIRLDEYFSQYYDSRKHGPYFAIGNEPSFGNPWIYNWSGHPWRTQEVVRKTLRDLFNASPGGLPGNDDLGATSSWIVFAQLGFFPEIPGVGGVTLNSPTFPDVTMMLGNHPLRITAPGSPDQLYVRNVTVDGSPIKNWWIGWDQLSKASQLSFALSALAEKKSGQAPPSFPPAVR